MEKVLYDNFKRILTLLNEAGEINGRIKFQKMVYILKNKGVPFNEKFKYHYFGPFSSDLQLEIDELVDRNILMERDANPYIYAITKENNVEFDNDLYVSEKKDLIQFLNKRDFKELEVISTIYFLENNGIKDQRILKKKIYALKPHLRDYIDSSFALKEKINSM